MAVYKFVIVLAIACALNGNANADDTCKERPSGDPKTCCAFPSKKKAEYVACAKEKRKENACWTECFADLTKVFVNGEFDKEAIVAVSGPYLEGEDPAWQPKYEMAIDACIARINERKQDDTKHMEHKGPHGANCNPKFIMLLHCINHEVFQNCPANFWTSSDECDAWKTFSTQCPHAHKMHGHHQADAE